MKEKLSKETLEKYYISDRLSVSSMSKILGCSETKINYWLSKYKIKKRTISESIYLHNNRNGDPFKFQKPRTIEEAFLYGLGIGLYWGEGNKKNKYSIRLGNTDPDLINSFLEFLKSTYHIDTSKLKFGLQIFSDTNPDIALRFWTRKLGVQKKYFLKVIVTPVRGQGTYKDKERNGVLTVYFNNKKLRDTICSAIENQRVLSHKLPT